MGIHDYQTALNQFSLANLMMLMGDYQAAQPNLERSVALRQQLVDGETTLAAPYIRLGELQIIAGAFAAAERYLEQSRSVLERPSNKENINWGWLFAKQGNLYRLQGEFVEAEAHLQRALLHFAERPPQYFGNLEVLNQLADLYLQTAVSPTHIDFIRLQNSFGPEDIEPNRVEK